MIARLAGRALTELMLLTVLKLVYNDRSRSFAVQSRIPCACAPPASRPNAFAPNAITRYQHLPLNHARRPSSSEFHSGYTTPIVHMPQLQLLILLTLRMIINPAHRPLHLIETNVIKPLKTRPP